MHIEAAAAKALAAIIISSTQGADALHSQLPLETVDRGGSWLVKGTPYTDARRGVHFCFSHVILRKDSAEVVAIGSDAKQILSEDESKHWHEVMSSEQFDRIFGLRTHFEESGDYLVRNLTMNAAIYGGLVNSPNDAVAYAKVILNADAHLTSLPASAYRAVERSEVWHVSVVDPKSGQAADVMSFSRINGKVLSGPP